MFHLIEDFTTIVRQSVILFASDTKQRTWVNGHGENLESDFLTMRKKR